MKGGRGATIVHASMDLPACYNSLLSRHHDFLVGVELLKASEVHRLLQERNDVRVESLPVRVFEVILLALQDGAARRNGNARQLLFSLSLFSFHSYSLVSVPLGYNSSFFGFVSGLGGLCSAKDLHSPDRSAR